MNIFYQGAGQEQQQTQRILTQFQENPEAWTKVDAILEQSQNAQSKCITSLKKYFFC